MAMQTDRVLRRLVLAAIRFYQRHLSPHKGFACAYRVHTGRASCSSLGYRTVRRHGVFDGLALLRRRTYLCGVAHRRHALAGTRPHARQRGECDCDLPCDFDASDCCDCDWPDRDKKKRQGDEKQVHIPPFSGRRSGTR